MKKTLDCHPEMGCWTALSKLLHDFPLLLIVKEPASFAT
jgi:hypothetical protein